MRYKTLKTIYDFGKIPVTKTEVFLFKKSLSKMVLICKFFSLYTCITHLTYSAEYIVYSPPVSSADSDDESDYHFNRESEMSKSYPERTAIYAFSRIENENKIIPKELQRIIYGYAHDSIWFLSKLQMKIVHFIEDCIKLRLETHEWNGVRIEYQEGQTNRILIVNHSDIQNPQTLRFETVQDIEGKMTQMERDCMNQMLLKRNPMLTVQKNDEGKILYAYTLDRVGGRRSYINPGVKNYCHPTNGPNLNYVYNEFPGHEGYDQHDSQIKRVGSPIIILAAVNL